MKFLFTLFKHLSYLYKLYTFQHKYFQTAVSPSYTKCSLKQKNYRYCYIYSTIIHFLNGLQRRKFDSFEVWRELIYFIKFHL